MHIGENDPISEAIIGHKYQLQYNETWRGNHEFSLELNSSAYQRKQFFCKVVRQTEN
jgi:hypothetical protein